MSTLNCKHLIWDWNGTLLDDVWLCIDVLNDMLSRRSLPTVTPFYHESFFDFPVEGYYAKVGFDFSIEPFAALADEFIVAYQERVRECMLRVGARETLEEARKRGISQSVLSALRHDLLVELLDYHDLSGYFTDIVGSSDHHARGKVEVAREWMAAQGMNPDEVIFIGDTTHDHDVAQALGTPYVCIHSGHHSRERLIATGGSLIETLPDLYRLIADRSNGHGG